MEDELSYPVAGHRRKPTCLRTSEKTYDSDVGCGGGGRSVCEEPLGLQEFGTPLPFFQAFFATKTLLEASSLGNRAGEIGDGASWDAADSKESRRASCRSFSSSS